MAEPKEKKEPEPKKDHEPAKGPEHPVGERLVGRARYVTRGAIFHDKKTIASGTEITADMLPKGDFERMKAEGVIVRDLRG